MLTPVSCCIYHKGPANRMLMVAHAMWAQERMLSPPPATSRVSSLALEAKRTETVCHTVASNELELEVTSDRSVVE